MVSSLMGGMAGGASVAIVIRGVDNFSKTFAKANTGVGKLSSGITKGMKLATAAIAVTGIAFAALGASSIKSAVAMETAMVGVRKTTGMTAEEIKGLSQDFVDLSKVLPVSARDLATIGEVAGQLGITGVENIKEFTRVSAMMSISTELTAEEAALAMAKISNAMGLPISEIEKLGSAINELSNISAASSSEIVAGMRKASGAANTLGISTPIVGGFTAAVIASGTQASRAGTQLTSAFNKVVKNIKKVSDFMGTDFKKALTDDADKAIQSLIQKISEIENPVERQQKALELFGDVGAKAINKLTNNMPEAIRLVGAFTEQMENATSLQEETDLAIQSSANQYKLLANNVEALKISLGNSLLPVVNRLMTAFVDLMPSLEPLIPIIGDALIQAMEAFIPFMPTIIDLIRSLAENVLPVAVEMFGRLSEMFTRLWPVIEPLLPVLMDLAMVIFDTGMKVLEALMPAIESLVPVLVELIEAIIPIIPDLTDLLLIITGVGVEVIKNLTPAVLTIITAFTEWMPIIEKVIGWLEILVTALGEVLTFISKIASAVGQGIFSTIASIGNAFSGGDQTKTTNVNDFILRPDGTLLKTHPDDTLIGMKDPNTLGQGSDGGGASYTINIYGDNYGTDPDDIAEALHERLMETIIR